MGETDYGNAHWCVLDRGMILRSSMSLQSLLYSLIITLQYSHCRPVYLSFFFFSPVKPTETKMISLKPSDFFSRRHLVHWQWMGRESYSGVSMLVSEHQAPARSGRTGQAAVAHTCCLKFCGFLWDDYQGLGLSQAWTRSVLLASWPRIYP